MSESVKVQVTLSADTAAKLAAICAEKGISKSAAVALAISEFYRKEEAK
jgi:hypothetical protein